jgi:biotin operon repressor
MTGLSRETVNGAISALRRRGSVSIEAGRFRVDLAADARE